MKGKNSIVLDYYEGTYGPTIRIDVQSVEALAKIRDFIQQLSESTISSIDLAEAEGINAAGFSRVIFEVSVGHKTEEKLLLCKNGSEGIIINWAMFPASWERVHDLVNGLLECGCSAHQYLTKEGVDDAIIELAFME